jgi:hypothetical protein
MKLVSLVERLCSAGAPGNGVTLMLCSILLSASARKMLGCYTFINNNIFRAQTERDTVAGLNTFFLAENMRNPAARVVPVEYVWKSAIVMLAAGRFSINNSSAKLNFIFQS